MLLPLRVTSLVPVNLLSDATDTDLRPVIGLVLLVSHIFNTQREERRLIWTARPSFTKYAFLVYRYLVPICLVFEFVSQSGFSGIVFTDKVCVITHKVFAPLIASTSSGMWCYHRRCCHHVCGHANAWEWSCTSPRDWPLGVQSGECLHVNSVYCLLISVSESGIACNV
jgi:hypothetical protein